MHRLHKAIKKITRSNKRRRNMLEDSVGNIICDEREKLREWEKYIEEIFADERHKTEDSYVHIGGPEILKSEILYTIN